MVDLDLGCLSRLPLEVREYIWRHLVKLDPPTNPRPFTTRPDGYHPTYITRQFPITRVNMCIRNETVATFLRENEFMVFSVKGLHRLLNQYNSIVDAAVHVRSLGIRHDCQMLRGNRDVHANLHFDNYMYALENIHRQKMHMHGLFAELIDVHEDYGVPLTHLCMEVSYETPTDMGFLPRWEYHPYGPDFTCTTIKIWMGNRRDSIDELDRVVENLNNYLQGHVEKMLARCMDDQELDIDRRDEYLERTRYVVRYLAFSLPALRRRHMSQIDLMVRYLGRRRLIDL